MFVTAQRIATDLGSPVVLAGPATSDVRGYDRFTDRLLDALDARGFVAGTRFAWTHHNYADVAYATSRTADVRRRLVGRWAGWPAGDAGNPQLLLTEGGVTLQTIARHLRIADPAAQRAKQGELLTAAFERLSGPRGRRRGARHAVPLPHRSALRQRAVRDGRAGRRAAARVRGVAGSALGGLAGVS